MSETRIRCSEFSPGQTRLHPGDDVTSEPTRYERLVANWRVGSHLTRTVDEYGIIFRNLFAIDDLEVSRRPRHHRFVGRASA